MAPILATMEYRHNEDSEFWIGRKVPDFYNEGRHLIVEYFGRIWHTEDEEEKLVAYYRERGWSCKILWEDDLYWFLTKFRYTISEEEFERSWRLAFGKRRKFPAIPVEQLPDTIQ